jgi:ABC-type sugar transport system ATPase subunit
VTIDPATTSPADPTGSAEATTTPPILEMRGVSKRYGSIQALDDVSLSLAPGEIHALLGENGAGKSTLIKIMTGVVQPDVGEILIDGKPVRIGSAFDAQTYAVAAIYQEPMVFPDLTVAENIFIGTDRVIINRRACVRGEAGSARRHLDVMQPARGDAGATAGRSSRRCRSALRVSSWTSPPRRSPRGAQLFGIIANCEQGVASSSSLITRSLPGNNASPSCATDAGLDHRGGATINDAIRQMVGGVVEFLRASRRAGRDPQGRDGRRGPSRASASSCEGQCWASRA